MRYRITLGAILIACVASPAWADCQKFVGRTVGVQDIDEVMKPFLAIGPKGEFETRAQYEARQAPLIAALPEDLIVAKEPESRDDITYDADTQQLNIGTFAFHNQRMPIDSIFGPDGPYAGLVDYSFYNIEVVIKSTEVVLGRYKASNAYGTTTSVSRILTRIRGIFDHGALPPDDGLFSEAAEKPYIAGSVAMPPDTARQIKNKIKLAFSVRPKAPYFVNYLDNDPSSPTLDFPTERTYRVSILIADIQCGLVLDPANVVLGAFATR